MHIWTIYLNIDFSINAKMNEETSFTSNASDFDFEERMKLEIGSKLELIVEKRKMTWY